jgi:hypothetical protein
MMRTRSGRLRFPGSVLLFCLFLTATPASAVGTEQDLLEDDSAVDIGGNVKLLGIGYDLSEISIDQESVEGSLASSLRLTLDGRPTSWFGYELHVRLVDQLSTTSFARIQAGQPFQDLVLFRGLGNGGTWVDGERHWLGADMAYANIRLTKGKTDLVVGRQAVTFGRSFFWNPIDWLSAFSPTEIDREYKTGVDAVRLTRALGRFSGVELLYAYGDGGDRERSALIGRLFGNLGGWDLEGLLGDVAEERQYGFAFSGDVGGAGVRGEASFHDPQVAAEPRFTRATLEVDYRWPGSLHLIGELHHNGFGSTDPDEYAALFQDPRFLAGRIRNVGQDYLAGSASYEFTPLNLGMVAVLVNLHDSSGLVNPTFTWSTGENRSVVFGANIPWGQAPQPSRIVSEFGSYPLTVWTQWRLYF